MVKNIENKFASVKIHKIAFTKGLGVGVEGGNLSFVYHFDEESF